MRTLLILTTTGLALFAGALSLAVPSHAARSGSLYSAQALAVQGEVAGTSEAAGTPAPTGTSEPSPTPSGNPINPGTGEPAESEGTRIDYAPYFIGAVLVITLVAALILWRRRGNKTIV
jgi:hypothetical protein